MGWDGSIQSMGDESLNQTRETFKRKNGQALYIEWMGGASGNSNKRQGFKDHILKMKNSAWLRFCMFMKLLVLR